MTDRQAPATPPAMEYRHDIDGLRALSVGVIVLFHAGVSALSGGYVGVDVFFVISGFLITQRLAADVAAERFSLSEFYMRRVRRLAPSLLATLAATLAAGHVLFAPELYEDLGEATVAALLSVSNIYFWTGAGYFDTEAIFKPLLHTWSLGVEEQFYLVWPLLLALLLRRAGLGGASLALALLSLASVVAAEWRLGSDPAAVFFLSPYRVAEFGLGAILALNPGRIGRLPAAPVLSVAALALILAPAALFDEATRFPGVTALVPCLGAAILLASGPAASANRWLAAAPLRYIGRISYSLYLAHWPIVSFYVYARGDPASWQEVAGLTAASVAAGALLYHGVETPFRRRTADGFAIGAPALGRLAVGASALVLVAALTVDQSDGLPQRIAPELRALVAEIRVQKDLRDRKIRKERCFVSEHQPDPSELVQAGCLPKSLDGAVVVLGDSHAADLWMGLRAAFPDRTFVQMSGAGCDLARSRRTRTCDDFYPVVEDWIARHRELLAAVIYTQRGAFAMQGDPDTGDLGAPDAAALERLGAGLQGIADLGVPLIVWGPRPEFHPRIGVQAARSLSIDDLQARFAATDLASFRALDKALARLLSRASIRYVSSLSALCHPDCPSLLADGVPVFVDYGHWSPEGAAFAATSVVRASPVLQAAVDTVSR